MDSHKKNLLDWAFPYPAQTSYPTQIWDCLQAWDAPAFTGLGWGPGVKVSVNDTFTMWVMARPIGVDGIWVPLARTMWWWEAVAEFDTQQQVPVLTTAKHSPASAFSYTVTFPKWKGVMAPGTR